MKINPVGGIIFLVSKEEIEFYYEGLKAHLTKGPFKVIEDGDEDEIVAQSLVAPEMDQVPPKTPVKETKKDVPFNSTGINKKGKPCKDCEKRFAKNLTFCWRHNPERSNETIQV